MLQAFCVCAFGSDAGCVRRGSLIAGVIGGTIIGGIGCRRGGYVVGTTRAAVLVNFREGGYSAEGERLSVEAQVFPRFLSEIFVIAVEQVCTGVVHCSICFEGTKLALVKVMILKGSCVG